MQAAGEPRRARRPSGSKSSYEFFTSEEIYTRDDLVGVFADDSSAMKKKRRKREHPMVTKLDDLSIDSGKTLFDRHLRMTSEDDGSICSRSSWGSEGTSHTSFELSNDQWYSSTVTVYHHRDKIASSSSSYPTPQPDVSKPQTPVRGHIMHQQLPSITIVDPPQLPPTPNSLRTTPVFGFDTGKRRRLPSPEIPSTEEITEGIEDEITEEIEEEIEEDEGINMNAEGEENEGDDEGWEDVEEEDEEDDNAYADDVYSDEEEEEDDKTASSKSICNDTYDGEEAAMELHYDNPFENNDNNTDEAHSDGTQ
ncbi:hypothetical protein AA313_de0207375 [Arthrobotrys entomopaga]|nr:hypothetical protein AA313_de0207375 [Arthrobotrys entomopaga]